MGSATRWKVVFEGVAGEKGDALGHFKLYAKLSRQAYSVVYHVQLSRLLKYRPEKRRSCEYASINIRSSFTCHG